MRQGPQRLHPGQRRDLRRRGKEANRRLQVLRPGAQPHRRLRQRTERRPAPFPALHRQLQQALDRDRRSRRTALQRDLQRQHRIRRDRFSQNDAFDQTLRRLPPVLRQGNTTFVNLRAALDDLEPLVDTAKPATKNLAPFLAELRPVLSKFVPFTRNLRLTVSRPGKANDTAELLAYAARRSSGSPPAPSRTAKTRSPPSSRTSTSSAPTRPISSTAIGKLGQVSRLLRRQRALRQSRARGAEPLRLQRRHPRNRSKAEQYDSFGSSAADPPPLPGRRHPDRRRRLQPLRQPAVQAAAASAPPNATRPTRPRGHDQAPAIAAAPGRRRGRGRPAGHRRQRRQRLRGSRDLRQWRLHGQRRAGPGRRRQRRQIESVDVSTPGRDRRLPPRRAGRRPRQSDHRR